MMPEKLLVTVAILNLILLLSELSFNVIGVVLS
jgi:hypothetical protein